MMCVSARRVCEDPHSSSLSIRWTSEARDSLCKQHDMNHELITTDIVHEMAARQRDISVSEFFLKNRHLLGFDSPSKAALTTVKEAVDNALDACEEAGILPEIWVAVSNQGDGVLQIAVEDNGPGIVEEQIARIFGKLLYGSHIEKYLPHIGLAFQQILDLNDAERQQAVDRLDNVLQTQRSL